MRRAAVALFLVVLLSGAAYGSRSRKDAGRHYPRDRVVEREIIRERPVYRDEKPSHKKWWQWRSSDDRKRQKEWEKDRKKREKDREKWEKDREKWEKEREKDRKRNH